METLYQLLPLGVSSFETIIAEQFGVSCFENPVPLVAVQFTVSCFETLYQL